MPAAAAVVAASTAGAPACGADASSMPPRLVAQPQLAGPFSPSLAANPVGSMAPAGAAVARAESRTLLPTASRGPLAAAPTMQLTAECITSLPAAATASPLPGLTAQAVMLLQLLRGLQAATPSAATAASRAATLLHEASRSGRAEAAASGATPVQHLPPAAQSPAAPGALAAGCVGVLTPAVSAGPAAGCGYCGQGSGSRSDVGCGSGGPATDLPGQLLLADLSDASPGAAAAAVAAAAAAAAVQAALGSFSAAGTHTLQGFAQLQALDNCSAMPPASHPAAEVHNPHLAQVPSHNSGSFAIDNSAWCDGSISSHLADSYLTAQGVASGMGCSTAWASPICTSSAPPHFIML